MGNSNSRNAKSFEDTDRQMAAIDVELEEDPVENERKELLMMMNRCNKNIRPGNWEIYAKAAYSIIDKEIHNHDGFLQFYESFKLGINDEGSTVFVVVCWHYQKRFTNHVKGIDNIKDYLSLLDKAIRIANIYKESTKDDKYDKYLETFTKEKESITKYYNLRKVIAETEKKIKEQYEQQAGETNIEPNAPDLAHEANIEVEGY